MSLLMPGQYTHCLALYWHLDVPWRNWEIPRYLPRLSEGGCHTCCVHTPRKCPIAVRPLVDKKLDKLLEQEVIVPVTEPTDWVSSLAYSWKADGDLRTCLNPTHLNKAIRRDHYRTPTLEEITHELAGSTKFTKVDGSSSYYCIVLDYESSLLTTFNTHRGRFRFVRLPFGLMHVHRISSRGWWTRS